ASRGGGDGLESLLRLTRALRGGRGAAGAGAAGAVAAATGWARAVVCSCSVGLGLLGALAVRARGLPAAGAPAVARRRAPGTGCALGAALAALPVAACAGWCGGRGARCSLTGAGSGEPALGAFGDAEVGEEVGA